VFIKKMPSLDNPKEEIVHLRQTRRINVKVHGLPTTKRTFKPAVLALISREGFGCSDRLGKIT
jgi:hypothetical protein